MISATLTVAEVLERHPETLDVFKRRGFRALASPFLRATFAHLVTIRQACERHGVELEAFLRELNDAAGSGGGIAPAGGTAGPACLPAVPVHLVTGPPDAGGGPVHERMNVAEAVGRFPETRPVFTRHFGAGCFTCPSFGAEDIGFACGMHGADPRAFVEACNAAVAGAREPGLEGLTLNEILRRHPPTAPILHRYGLDACCGGAKTLAVAAAAHGLALDDLAGELRAVLPPGV